jgi:ArsR family transcriptional regulator, arsenate/arsenite/antimonite-responsive transcriptional repressor / arsenate reductase (thioredoxin)
VTVISPPEFLKLLAHELRWQLLVALAESDRRVQELVDLVARPMNLVSYHLRLLRSAGIVQEHRSSADGRDLYYTLALPQIAQQFHSLGYQLHPALGYPPIHTPRQIPARVLFLCTRNSARSQMAEALLRTYAEERPIEVVSAGSHPSVIDPDAIRALATLGIDIAAQQSKHLELFRNDSFDYVITVCDQVREECPDFSGKPNIIHWSIPDPVVATGTAAERLAVFTATAQELATRVNHLLIRLDAEAIESITASSRQASSQQDV